MYYVSRFLGFLTPLPPPLSSIVSIWHDPPLVLRKIFETPPPPPEQKKNHVVHTYDGLTAPGKKSSRKEQKLFG